MDLKVITVKWQTSFVIDNATNRGLKITKKQAYEILNSILDNQVIDDFIEEQIEGRLDMLEEKLDQKEEEQEVKEIKDNYTRGKIWLKKE